MSAIVAEFVVFNVVFALLSTIVIVFALWRDRFLVVKPSFVVVTAFHVLIQWPATVEASHVAAFLESPYPFAYLVHGFVLLGALGSVSFGRRSAKSVWSRLVALPPSAVINPAAIVFLLILTVAIAAFYLSVVPPSSSGLYAVLTGSGASATVREESLKLIASPLVRYSYSFLMSIVGPFLAVTMTLVARDNLKRGNVIAASFSLFGIAGVLVVVSLTGARSPAAQIILVMLIALFIQKGFPIRVRYLLIGTLLVLSVPIAFTILREGRVIGASLVLEYLRAVLIDRVFIAPMEVAQWYVHYAETHGYFGVQAIPKMAVLFDVPPVNVPNIVGLTYEPDPLPTVNANVSYVFSYYSYFGAIAFPFALGGLYALDLALWVYGRLSEAMLLPAVAVVTLSSLAFIHSDYSTVLITHGFIPALVLAVVVDRMTGMTQMARRSAVAAQ